MATFSRVPPRKDNFPLPNRQAAPAKNKVNGGLQHAKPAFDPMSGPQLGDLLYYFPQDKIVQQAVQMSVASRKAAVESPRHIHGVAAQGVQGAGQPLPYREKLQAAFGHHDLSHVQAYTDASAAHATQSLNAEAYTMGNKIAFADPNPSLATVAHEATHVVQQRQGVQLKSNVGEVGDRYEQQADQVANAVQQNRSAKTFLDNASNNTASSSSSFAIQMKLKENGTDIDATNINTKATNLHTDPNLTHISVVEINSYLNELITIIGDEETYDFPGGNLILYLIERHKNSNFTKLLSSTPKNNEKYLYLKTFLHGHNTLYNFTRNGFPAKGGLFNIGYTFPDTPETISEGRLTSGNWEAPFYTKKMAKNLPATASPNIANLNLSTTPTMNYTYTAEGFGTPPLQTRIYWGDVIINGAGKKVMGTEVLAFPLGPDHPLGEDTGSQEAEAKDSTDKYKFAIGQPSVSGHLLNNNVGGPPTVYNLVPFPATVNKKHEKLEDEVKKLVNNQHRWIWYHVKVNRQLIPNPDPTNQVDKCRKDITSEEGKKSPDKKKIKSLKAKLKSLADTELKSKAYRNFIHFDYHCISNLEVAWGQLDVGGNALRGAPNPAVPGPGVAKNLNDTKKSYTIRFPDPMDINYLNAIEKKTKKSPFFKATRADDNENQYAIDDPTNAKSPPDYYEFILETPKGVRAQLQTAPVYIKELLDNKMSLNQLQTALTTLNTAVHGGDIEKAVKSAFTKSPNDLSDLFTKIVDPLIDNAKKIDVGNPDETLKFIDEAEKLRKDLKSFNVDSFTDKFITANQGEFTQFLSSDVTAQQVLDKAIKIFTKLHVRELIMDKQNELNNKLLEVFKGNTNEIKDTKNTHLIGLQKLMNKLDAKSQQMLIDKISSDPNTQTLYDSKLDLPGNVEKIVKNSKRGIDDVTNLYGETLEEGTQKKIKVDTLSKNLRDLFAKSKTLRKLFKFQGATNYLSAESILSNADAEAVKDVATILKLDNDFLNDDDFWKNLHQFINDSMNKSIAKFPVFKGNERF